MRSPLILALTALASAVAASRGATDTNPRPARPNVLLVVMDTVRADVRPTVLALSGLTRKAAA